MAVAAAEAAAAFAFIFAARPLLSTGSFAPDAKRPSLPTFSMTIAAAIDSCRLRLNMNQRFMKENSLIAGPIGNFSPFFCDIAQLTSNVAVEFTIPTSFSSSAFRSSHPIVRILSSRSWNGTKYSRCPLPILINSTSIPSPNPSSPEGISSASYCLVISHRTVSFSIPFFDSTPRSISNTLFPSGQHPIKYPPTFKVSDRFRRKPLNLPADSNM